MSGGGTRGPRLRRVGGVARAAGLRLQRRDAGLRDDVGDGGEEDDDEDDEAAQVEHTDPCEGLGARGAQELLRVEEGGATAMRARPHEGEAG